MRLGKTAWDAGRYAEAIEQWRRAAAKGDSRSMRQLGQVHKKGLGVVQDYVEAHMWFNLASSRGDAVALRERDALRGKMTSEQLALAQKRAREWGSPRKAVESSSKTGSEAKDGRTGRFIQGRSATCDVPETVESSSARDEGRH